TITTLHQAGVTTFVELGPDATLTAMAATTLAGSPAVLVPVLQPNRPEPHALLAAVGAAHVNGHPVTWPVHGRTLPLPTYAFQRRRYWLDPVAASAVRSADGELWEAVAAGDEASLARLLSLDAAQRGALAELLPALGDWHSSQASAARTQEAVQDTESPVTLRERLAGMSGDEVDGFLLETVRQYTADVLGLGDAELIDVRLEFLELGLSSFTALELSKRLGAEGLELDPVAVYDHPTPAALAEHLRSALLTAR
ncbi:phosphopantetheine-binding protein, partial [Streptomyces sp. NPDC048275]|uniref:acyl carrier protein n=1 Tax=Streptomyces sp. NPDC048275 TaxID=3155629 RepID=UPI0034017500